MKDLLLEKYARLIVKTGINLQKNQMLVISAPIECASFARTIAEIAYREGARDVVMNWKDELMSKIRYLNAPDEIFDEFPDWQKEFYISHARRGAAFLSIAASDPELMKDVNPDRMVRALKASGAAIKEYRERLMSNRNAWCVVSIPTGSWAKKVFPDVPEEEAVELLWDAIFKTVRVDMEDPVAGWNSHKENLKKRIAALNDSRFAALHFWNSAGTDLKVKLPEGHIWMGGSELTADGIEFIANMPTEEIFTLPDRNGVDGIVVSTRPLNYNGSLIDEFSLTFKDGKIVDFSAGKGYDTLKNLLEADKGSRYLGEVALVPYDSPISNSNILFFNTLFDENASCHLAIGKAYPMCIKNSDGMSAEELEKAGVNDSIVHEDFMIGSGDLEITGITADGREVPVFRNGNFAM